MARVSTPSHETPFVNVSHARWVTRVLNMLIAVVGRESLLGLILRQTRTEIGSIVPDEKAADATAQAAACYENN